MKLVIAIGYGAWQERVLSEQGANFRLGSFFYVKEKQFEPMWDKLRKQREVCAGRRL